LSSVALWSDISTAEPDDMALVAAALFEPIDYLIARPDQLAELRVPDRIEVACVVDCPADLERATETARIAVVSDMAQGAEARDAGLGVALRATVDDRETLERARTLATQSDHLIVRFSDETNIPLELLLAESQGTGVGIVKEVATVEDARIAIGVLEHGPAGILLSCASSLAGIGKYVKSGREQRLDLVEATVTSARPVGLGYRACIDTVSLFEEDEGFVVGSTSSGGLLVCAEVHYLPYMNLRPFRVNAGAVHSYTWGSGVTEYVTDLAPGSELLAVSTAGEARPVTVGRVKIEVRSLRLIEATADGVGLNVFVQDDWHVRLFGADGKPRNSSEIVPGDALLAHVCRAGRHVGIPIEETIDER
jgi:3-amino-4-hydroxybenzoic acid synthase